MDEIQSVPYKVSGRWVFYQLVQKGLLSKSVNDYQRLRYILSQARKGFYRDPKGRQWNPEILEDSIRECSFHGELGFSSPYIELDIVKHQSYYVQVWFEAQAMFQQFVSYAFQPFRVSLIPFRGDSGIPQKWKIAKKLEKIHKKYGKPIKVLYFGDYDKKGLQIPRSALKDIKSWCNVPFDFERIGLSLQQAKKFNIPENPEKPNQYQWEALSDSQAKQLITEALERYLKPIPSEALELEQGLENDITEFINDTLLEKQSELDKIMR